MKITRRVKQILSYYEGETPGGVMDVSLYTTSYKFDVPNNNLRTDTERTPLFEAFQFFPPPAC